METPASRGRRADTGEAMKEMAVTTRKAAEKSESCGPACPEKAMAPARTAEEMQMPRDRVSCWKVE